VVTTCHAAGWEKYGRRMAESFVRFWPSSIRLTVYAEGFTPDVAGIDVASLPAWQEEFKARYGAPGGDPVGIGPDGKYNYRRDCVRFSHKVGAITDAARAIGGHLIWMDADTVTHAPVDVAWLRTIYPGGRYLAWLDRHDLYPECGFLIFDTEHRGHAELMRRFEWIYRSGAVFAVEESHDSFVLEHIVDQAIAEGVIDKPFSLSGVHRRSHHPFVRCRLAERLDHLKGRRKDWGRSTDKDTGGPRSEPYWRGKIHA
jgi:hypothetical protein